jgi:hypothetical protein
MPMHLLLRYPGLSAGIPCLRMIGSRTTRSSLRFRILHLSLCQRLLAILRGTICRSCVVNVRRVAQQARSLRPMLGIASLLRKPKNHDQSAPTRRSQLDHRETSTNSRLPRLSTSTELARLGTIKLRRMSSTISSSPHANTLSASLTGRCYPRSTLAWA